MKISMKISSQSHQIMKLLSRYPRLRPLAYTKLVAPLAAMANASSTAADMRDLTRWVCVWCVCVGRVCECVTTSPPLPLPPSPPSPPSPLYQPRRRPPLTSSPPSPSPSSPPLIAFSLAHLDDAAAAAAVVAAVATLSRVKSRSGSGSNANGYPVGAGESANGGGSSGRTKPGDDGKGKAQGGRATSAFPKGTGAHGQLPLSVAIGIKLFFRLLRSLQRAGHVHGLLKLVKQLPPMLTAMPPRALGSAPEPLTVNCASKTRADVR